MNTFSIKITSVRAENLKEILKNKGCKFDSIQYAIWRAKSNDFQVIFYNSGKLLIQGKNIDNILNELNIIPKEQKIETSDLMKDCELYIGTDESGKGDFFGPLVIAGVQVNSEIKKFFEELGIKDSKKLDDKKIKQLAVQIKNKSVYSVIVINPLKYNELYSKFNNLNKLLAWGHARAIENILEKNPCENALADKFGDETLIKNALMTKGRNINLKQTVRAEADIAVAAASILARAEFVNRIEEMEEKFMLPFSKGVSSKIVEQAKKFIQEYSYNRLSEVAKMHFKTVNDIHLSNIRDL